MRSAVQRLIQASVSRRQFSPTEVQSLLQTPLSAGELTTLASAMVEGFYSQSCTAPVLAALEARTDILSSSNISDLLFFSRTAGIAGKRVTASWQAFTLSSMKTDLISSFLTLTRDLEYCQALDLALQSRELITPTSNSIASLLWAMVYSKYQFSQQSYERVLKAAVSLLYTAEDVAKVALCTQLSKLPQPVVVRVLQALSPQVLAKAHRMSDTSKTYTLSAYSTVPMECSHSVLYRVVRNLQVAEITVDHMVYVVNALCQFSVPGDERVFKEVEAHFLRTRYVPGAAKLGLAVHAYAKRGLGSAQLFALFEHLFLREKPKMKSDEVKLMYYSFLRSVYTRPEFKEMLKKSVGDISADTPTKLESVLRYWSGSLAH